MAQAESVAIPKRLPLGLEPQNRYGSTDKDAKLVNWFISTEQDGEGKDQWIYTRPGLLEQSRPPAANAAGLGCFFWEGDVYAVFADTLYKSGVAVPGTVNTAGGQYRFSSTLGATKRLFFSNSTNGYYYDSGGGLVAVTDPDFPTTLAKGSGYLDGTTYVMTPSAHIQGSDFNDPSAWDPLNDILAQIEPDGGRALAKQLVYIIAFKAWSTEVFYDAGNATGSPLGPVQGAKQNYGIVSGDSFQSIDNILLWVCSSQTAGTQVARMDNLKLEIISTPAVERLIQTVDWTTTYSWQLSLDGHRFYGITSVVSNLTLVYDLDENKWSQWTDANGNYFPIASSTYDSSQRAIFQHASNGRLYYASAAYTNDNGDPIIAEAVTPNFDGGVGSRQKQMNALFFIGDINPGSELEVYVSDDDYQTWENKQLVDMGQELPCLTNQGTFYRRAHKIIHRGNNRQRLKAVEMQVDIGTL